MTHTGLAGTLLRMISVVKTCACCCVRAHVPVAAEVLLRIMRND